MREVREEIGLEAREVRFNHSHYFAPSNTLMLYFTVTVDDEEAHPNWEVDSWQWFPIEEARRQIKRQPGRGLPQRISGRRLALPVLTPP